MSDNKLLKIIIILTIIIIIGTTLGLINNYTLFKWSILLAISTLFFISIFSKRYKWSVIFCFFVFLFNPIYPFYLSKILWIIFDILLIISLVYWFWDYFNNYHKGLIFEKFVQKLFPSKDWVILDYTKDLHKKIKRFVESDKNPDFIFKRKQTGNVMAVECKYRSEYKNNVRFGKGIYWKKEQGDRYNIYSNDNNIPVYVAIGIGGNPNNPKDIFFIPIHIIQERYYKFIPIYILERYRKIPVI